jgi:hypothetical protein
MPVDAMTSAAEGSLGQNDDRFSTSFADEVDELCTT